MPSRPRRIAFLLGACAAILSAACGTLQANRELVARASSSSDGVEYAMYIGADDLALCRGDDECVSLGGDEADWARFEDPLAALSAAFSIVSGDDRSDECALLPAKLAAAVFAATGSVFLARRSLRNNVIAPLSEWIDFRPNATDARTDAARRVFAAVRSRATEAAVRNMTTSTFHPVDDVIARAALSDAVPVLEGMVARGERKPLSVLAFRVKTVVGGVEHLVEVPQTFVQVAWIEITLTNLLASIREVVLSPSVRALTELGDRSAMVKGAIAGFVTGIWVGWFSVCA